MARDAVWCDIYCSCWMETATRTSPSCVNCVLSSSQDEFASCRTRVTQELSAWESSSTAAHGQVCNVTQVCDVLQVIRWLLWPCAWQMFTSCIFSSRTERCVIESVTGRMLNLNDSKRATFLVLTNSAKRRESEDQVFHGKCECDDKLVEGHGRVALKRRLDEWMNT